MTAHPMQIKFLRDHPAQKTLFPNRSATATATSEVFVMHVHNAFLINAGSAYALPVCEGYILDEFTPYSEYILDLAKDPNFLAEISHEISAADEICVRKGRYVPLIGPWCKGFYHWMMEFVPRAVAMVESGYDGNYIIPLVQFAWDSLILLGIPPERIAPYDAKPWLVETLVIPQPINGYNELKRYPSLIELMRERFLSAVGNSDASPKRIYLARSPDAPRQKRKVVNDAELLALLDKYAFKPLITEEMPLNEQIRTIAGADCLLGPHGAGMVHCLFMKPGSLVMELFSPMYINPCLVPVLDHLRHRYFMIPSTKNRDYSYGEDIVANISVIELTLKRELGA
jgi:hypothetical protein